MNFFAHACLALARRAESRFALGAMLPDWTRWVDSRIAGIDDPLLAAGARFHHAVDDAFHASPTFTVWQREAHERLRGLGLARGPARGAAHVGVELLLDGVLAEDPRWDRGYLAALDAGPDAVACVRWRDPGAPTRLARVIARLREHGVPREYADPAVAADRIARTLAHRPHLRVPDAHRPALAAWAREAQPALRRDAATLLAETEAGLDARGT